MNKHDRLDFLSALSLTLILVFFSLIQLIFNLASIATSPELASLLESPKLMAERISAELILPLQVLILAFPGWLCSIAVLLFAKNYSKRYFRFLVCCMVALIINIPFGVFLGVPLAIVLFTKRHNVITSIEGSDSR